MTEIDDLRAQERDAAEDTVHPVRVALRRWAEATTGLQSGLAMQALITLAMERGAALATAPVAHVSGGVVLMPRFLSDLEYLSLGSEVGLAFENVAADEVGIDTTDPQWYVLRSVIDAVAGKALHEATLLGGRH